MGVSATAVARVTGIDTAFKNLRGSAAVRLPQRVAVIGQGAESVTYATTPFTATSSSAVGSEFGFGSPLHLAARMLLPANGDGLGDIPLTMYPVQADGSGVQSLGDITPVGTTQSATAEYTVLIGGIPSAKFVITAGTVVLNDIGEAIDRYIEGLSRRAFLRFRRYLYRCLFFCAGDERQRHEYRDQLLHGIPLSSPAPWGRKGAYCPRMRARFQGAYWVDPASMTLARMS